ncbi:MAG: type II toxin-antitoxin system HicB family antitoxin [Tetragenococcus koreensis]|nr:type II toxin-antitoxin system HicB family antitoxin [Tetragenococcus koreensis]
MLIYPATFEKDGKYILVKFPDIPEAMTQAETVEQAYEKATEVLGLVLEDKKDFPKASGFEDMQKKYPDKQVALIGLDLAAHKIKYNSKSVRKSVTVPEWLNDVAVSEQINFSQTLTEALKEKLEV